MTDAITTFNQYLQSQAKDLQARMTALNLRADAGLDHAGQELRRQIDALEAKAVAAKTSLEASVAVVQKWADDSVEAVEDWKTRLDVSMLKARADRADRYAKAASEVAIRQYQRRGEGCACRDSGPCRCQAHRTSHPCLIVGIMSAARLAPVVGGGGRRMPKNAQSHRRNHIF
jgi:hypothetical protein